MAAMFWYDGSVHHVSEYCRLQPRGVGIDQEKQGIVGEQFCGKLDQREYILLDLPDFSFGTAPVGGRIHDDAVVGIAAAELPFHKFYAVVHQPADRRVR